MNPIISNFKKHKLLRWTKCGVNISWLINFGISYKTKLYTNYNKFMIPG